MPARQIYMRNNVVVAALSLILAAACATAPRPVDTSDAALVRYLKGHAKAPEDYVVAKFAKHDVVFLGEYHRIKHDLTLVHRLIPRLHAAGIYNLGIEIADNDAQAEVDALITADRYDADRARKIAFEFDGAWGYLEYQDIYRAAWDLNHALPPGARRFRVVNLGYRPRWRERTEDPETIDKAFYKGDPDAYMAGVIIREFVDRKEKALIFSGMHHAFTRFHQPYFDKAANAVAFNQSRMGNLVHARIGDRAFTIALHAPWQARDYDGPLIRPMEGAIDRVLPMAGLQRAGFDVKGSPFGALRGGEPVYAMGDPDFTLAAFCDGYIYQGPFSSYEGVSVDPQFLTEENFRDAVERIANPRARSYFTAPEELMESLRRDTDFARRFKDVR